MRKGGGRKIHSRGPPGAARGRVGGGGGIKKGAASSRSPRGPRGGEFLSLWCFVNGAISVVRRRRGGGEKKSKKKKRRKEKGRKKKKREK